MTKKTKKSKIKKEMTFAELLRENPEATNILLQEGMHCANCPFASQETIEQGSRIHGVKIQDILEKLNKKKKKNLKKLKNK